MVRRCMGGPNALYLTDELTAGMHLKEGMTVLDLGCGRALSSVFLAREYGVKVYAVDRDVRAYGTMEMLKDLHLDDCIFPIQADAAAMPLPHGVFDALVCVNAYHNFGMEGGFFEEKIRPLLKPHAEIGLVLLGRDEKFVKEDDKNENPAFWVADEWKAWMESEGISVTTCDYLSCTKQAWRDWLTVTMPDFDPEDQAGTKIKEDLALIRIIGHWGEDG